MSSSSNHSALVESTSKPVGEKSGFIFTGGKNNIYSCNYCNRDITTQFRVCCAVCENYDMCADCFAAGAQKYPHENTHDYRVVDCLDMPLFTKDWTINEELMLLEGT